MSASRVEPIITGSLDDNHALLALVSSGLGACIVPELVLREAGTGISFTLSSQRLGVSRTILGVTRRSANRSHAQVVVALARAAAKR